MAPGSGIFSDDKRAERDEIVGMLTKAYWMEIETVMSYIANSVNPEGIQAREVVDSLAADVAEELSHAQLFAKRIKELYGTVPGSQEFTAVQSFLQPPDDSRDITHVIKGVIDAERGALEHYEQILEKTAGVDPVTEDLVTTVIADEQGHLRMFEGFLREFESG